MSRTIDNAANVLRYKLNEGIPLAYPWDDLSEEAKESYRELVWSILHAMLSDINDVTVHPKGDVWFEQDVAVMLYTGMATPKNSRLGVMNQEGRTIAEAFVAALDGALGIRGR